MFKDKSQKLQALRSTLLLLLMYLTVTGLKLITLIRFQQSWPYHQMLDSEKIWFAWKEVIRERVRFGNTTF